MTGFAERVREAVEPDSVARAIVEPNEFRDLGGRYQLVVPGIATFDLDHLRREGGHLKAEMMVTSTLPGARTVDGTLSVLDVNLSSQRTRKEAAKYLGERSNASEVDWTGLVEEIAQRTLAAERRGSPAVDLSDVPAPTSDQTLLVDGVPLLAHHPMIVFGDGGTGKSLIALHLAGKLAQDGHRILFADFELDAADHRGRLGRLFGSEMPRGIFHARCSRPFAFEAERLRQIAREREITYLIVDSIAPGCDGPPEAAEVATRYTQALRSFPPGIGSLHLAHQTKGGENAGERPFGSTFWHNNARSSWNIKPAGVAPGDDILQVALHHKKHNTTGRHPSVGLEIRFHEQRIVIRNVDPASVPDLAVDLSLPQRIYSALRSGSVSRAALMAELSDADADSVRKAINRGVKAGRILRLPGPDECLALPYRGGGQ